MDTTNNRVIAEKEPVSDKKEISKMKNILRKLSTRKAMTQFKIDFKENDFFTAVSIVSPEFQDVISEKVDNVKNATVIVCDPEIFEQGGDTSEFEATCKENITDQRVKAVTTVGVRVPMDFCKKFGVMYLFDYDPETEVLRCLRSN